MRPAGDLLACWLASWLEAGWMAAGWMAAGWLVVDDDFNGKFRFERVREYIRKQKTMRISQR